MSSSSSEAESPDIKPKNPENIRSINEKRSDETKGETEKAKAEEEKTAEGGEEASASGWRKAWNKTAFTFTSSRDSAAAAAAAKKEAAAQKLRATQESIIASKNAAAEAAIAKKNAAAEAAYAKKEAATAAAIAKKEAAAARLKETGDNIKSSTNNATSAVKSSSTNAAASVNAGFWNVVGMAQKAAVDPKSFIPGRAADSINIVHFNDVTNDPSAAAGHFMTELAKTKADDNPLVLFSGNAISPCMMNAFTRGEQMVPMLNLIGTSCAVFGNHDFDFGLDTLSELIPKCNFPWVVSNITDTESGQPLGGAKVFHTLEWQGRKIGIIGLVEREWLETLTTLDQANIDYTDFVDAASLLTEDLKRKGCEFIIALSHMRTDNDVRLAEKVPEIGLILGGHSAVYEKRKVNGVSIVKSGSQFKEFSKININFKESPAAVEVECINVDQEESEEHAEMKQISEEFNDFKEKEEEVLAKVGADLDGRFSTARTSETNLGNFIADVMMAALKADCAIINSGTIRSNLKHPKGEFKMKDLVSVLPVIESLVLIEVKGEHIHQALENGVSKWPKLDSRFPQVGGISFIFDPSKPPGARVDAGYVKIGNEYLDMKHHYKLATKVNMVNGEDGYSALSNGVMLMDDRCAHALTTVLINHFKSVRMKKRKEEDEECAVSVHLQPLVTTSSYHSDRDISKRRNTAAKLKPKVEGRIQQSSPELLAQLKEEKENFKTGSSKKKSKNRSSSPKDETRDALFNASSKKQNGVKTKSKKSHESDDLK